MLSAQLKQWVAAVDLESEFHSLLRGSHHIRPQSYERFTSLYLQAREYKSYLQVTSAVKLYTLMLVS